MNGADAQLDQADGGAERVDAVYRTREYFVAAIEFERRCQDQLPLHATHCADEMQFMLLAVVPQQRLGGRQRGIDVSAGSASSDQNSQYRFSVL